MIGEFAWHSLTVDPTIESVSKAHYDSVIQVLRLVDAEPSTPLRILEVGCYAHTTGYMLQKNLGAQVTLYDLSARALLLGRTMAGLEPGTGGPRLIAGDFHNLPFDDHEFDFAFITSALHHTWRWKRVLLELLRVVRPGGILLLENEPCLREACFYLFRTNRVEAFTPFEKELDSLGLIRTVAEPYLGSRPETLFGMVENQRIPLDRLLATIESRAELIEVQLDPMIAGLEQSWLEGRSGTISALEAVIEDSLLQRIGKAEKLLGEEARALGFDLPDRSRVRDFARRVARLVAALPDPADPGYRLQLARVFGSSVRIQARGRKRRSAFRFARWLMRPSLVESNGIAYSYPPAMRRLLVGDGSHMPNLQTCRLDELEPWFPPDHWSPEMGENGIRSVVLRDRKGTIRVPAAGARTLVLLRFYGASGPNRPLRIRIRQLETDLATWVICGGESFLFSKVISTRSPAALLQLDVMREEIPRQAENQAAPGHLSICLAAALAL